MDTSINSLKIYAQSSLLRLNSSASQIPSFLATSIVPRTSPETLTVVCAISMRRYIPAIGPIMSIGSPNRFRKIAPVTIPPPGMPGAAIDIIVEIIITIVIWPGVSVRPYISATKKANIVLYKAAPVRLIVAPSGIEKEAMEFGIFNRDVVTSSVIGMVPALDVVAIVLTQTGIIALDIFI